MTRVLLALALAFSAPALAASPIQDEVKADKQALRDDRQDARQIERYLRKWTRAQGHEAREARLDGKIDAWVREELAENRVETRAARAEFERMGGDARALEPDRYGRTQKVRVPERARDDGRDFEQARNDLRNTRELAQELRGIQPRFDEGRAGQALYGQKTELLVKLVKSAQRDVRRSEKELAEDQAVLDRRR